MSETGALQDDQKTPAQTSSIGFSKMVDPDYDPEEEKLLDQKFDSVWQPQWAGESRCWRIFVRGAVIGLAIALLWLTSLTLATTIAGIYVTAPSYNDAVNQWSFAAQIASQEQANAGECVTREIATCYRVLNKTYEDLLLKASEEALRNDLIVQAESTEASFCQKSWDGAYLATSKMLKTILLNESLYSQGLPNSNCSADDVVRLKQLLGDVSQQKSDVYLSNVQYSRDSNSFLQSAADSAANRSSYDAWYIKYKLGYLGNWSFKLWNASFFHIADIDAQFDNVNVSVSSLVNCIGLNGSCSFSTNAKSVYDTMKSGVETTYNATKAAWDIFANNVNRFNTSIHVYFQQVDAIFARLSVFGDVNKVLKQVFGSVPNPLDADYPDWRDFGALDFAPIPVDIVIPTAAAQFAQVQPTLAAIMPGISAAKKKVHDAAVRWMNSINDSFYFPNVGFSIPNYFADYNPPPIVVDTSGFNLVTDNFLTSSRVSLDGFNTLDSVSFNYTKTSTDFAQIIKKLPTFSSFSLMSAPFEGSFDFYNVFASLGSIMFLLISADVIYRIFSSVGIVRKYTRMAELGLPVIDIREFEAAKQSQNPTMAMYYLMTSPFIIVIILAVIGLIILGALVALYIPMYQSYQQGCVQSNNGTMITKNAYAFAYNYAAADANSATGDGLSKYDKQRTEYCTTATAQFNDRQTNAQDGLTKIRQTYDNNANDLALYQRCVVPEALPADPAYWMNITQYDSPYSNASIAARLQCDRAGVYITTGLGDGSFDCTKLPPCNLTCGGPDKDALMAVTYDSGCVSEWTFHAGLFRTLLGLLVFVCINISRVLLMTAVIRLSWRQLTSKGFEFQGTCSKMGDCEGLEARLKVAVQKAIKSYERGALAMLVVAVLIHLPYLLVLHQYGDHLNANGVHP